MRKPLNPLPLLAASAVLALAFLPLAVFNYDAESIICKVGSILCLLILALNQRPIFPALVAALAFSAGGDFLLELRHIGRYGPSVLFLFGLAAFLFAHLCYIALFAPRPALGGTPPLRRFGTILIVGMLALMFVVLWPSLGVLRIPVVLYGLALSTMGITAQQSYFRGMVALGGVTFVVSDSLLALQHFHGHFPMQGPLIWFSYYAAQVLLTMGVLTSDHRQAEY